MVKDKSSRMSLFVADLGRASSKEGRAAMLICDMNIYRVMVYVEQVEREKLRNKEENRTNKAKTGNDYSKIKSGPCRPQIHKSMGHAPSSASVPAPRNRGEYDGQNSQNFKARPILSPVAPQDRVAPRGATCGTGRGANCLFAITSRQEQQNSPHFFTGMINVFTFDVYALLDPRQSLSLVTPYVRKLVSDSS
ncbi:uncharacterized protein LOC107006333 [Solanum pennellii]|uniref:Uncharacterized protein LOC107006333 n=1 Tax=Solanum pennellii TaxID=28526 RepID=A0ABM1FQV4_SOLPN|nr:uncharacterized protein LOC107006333 [Solanum pennellii]